MASIEQGEKQIAAGELFTIDQLKEKTAKWLNTKS
jgi:predicted transcriptional regulator